MPMMNEIWDIQDRCPVEEPEFEVAFQNLNTKAQQIHMRRYQNAVNALPRPARDRFMRSMATVERVIAIIEHGIKNQLTSP